MALVLNRSWIMGYSHASEAAVASYVPEAAPATAAFLNVPPVELEVDMLPVDVPATMAVAPLVRRPRPAIEVTNPVPEQTTEDATPPREPLKAERLTSLRADVIKLRYIDAASLTAAPMWEVRTPFTPRSAFHIGPHVQFSKTSILKDRLFNTYDGSPLTAQTDFGVMFGVIAGYNFKNRIGIEAGVNFLSFQGQRYEGVVGQNVVSQEVMLNYMNFPVYLKLKQQVAFNQVPIVLNLLVGGHYGRLKSAQLFVDGSFPGEDVSTLVAQEELAWGGGLEADFYIDPRLYITLGGRASVSQDISGLDLSGKEQMRNLLIGANFGLNFALTK
jgi:hypothetical protein